MVVLLLRARSGLPEFPGLDLVRLDPPLRAALEAAAGAVRRSPDSAGAWGELGMLCHAHLLYPEARRAYRRAAELAPADRRWPHLLGLACELDSVPEEARAAFARARELDPGDLVATISLARLLQDGGRVDEARQLLLAAVKVDPRSVAAHVGLGQLAAQAGVLDMAEKNLALALEGFPRCGPAHAALSQVYSRQGKSELAAFHRRWSLVAANRIPLPDPLMEEVESRGVSYTARMRRGQLLGSLGRWREAAEQFQAAVDLRGDLAEPRYYLGASRVESGEADAGIAELARAAVLEGRKADAWLRISRARAGRGDLAGAEAAIAAALDAEPGSAEALVVRGDLRRREGKKEQALADYDRAIQLAPGDARAHLARGEVLLEPGVTREEAARDPDAARREAERAAVALAAFERALELRADLADAYEGAGRARMQLGQHAPAGAARAAQWQAGIEHFSRLVKYFPERQSGHVALIKALHAAGRVDESVAAIAAARARWPDDARFQKQSRPSEAEVSGMEEP
jgi:tetratricopeptide (TPR) repeat protein